MANFSIKADLLKLKGACLTNIKGRTQTKRCVVIPVDDAELFVGEKGVYLNMVAMEMQEPKFGDTHYIKVSVDKDRYNSMTEAERKQQPILGGMRILERNTLQPMAPMSTLDGSSFVDDNDLPF